MGIYVVEPAAVEHVPRGGRYYDLPDLVQALLAAGAPVGSLPSTGRGSTSAARTTTGARRRRRRSGSREAPDARSRGPPARRAPRARRCTSAASTSRSPATSSRSCPPSALAGVGVRSRRRPPALAAPPRGRPPTSAGSAGSAASCNPTWSTRTGCAATRRSPPGRRLAAGGDGVGIRRVPGRHGEARGQPPRGRPRRAGDGRLGRPARAHGGARRAARCRGARQLGRRPARLCAGERDAAGACASGSGSGPVR